MINGLLPVIGRIAAPAAPRTAGAVAPKTCPVEAALLDPELECDISKS